MKSAAQVALNWLICIAPVVPIPRTSKMLHMEGDVGAMGWRLRLEDWEKSLKGSNEQIDCSMDHYYSYSEAILS